MACFSVCVVLLCSFGLLLVVYGFFFCVFSFGLPFVFALFLVLYPFLSLSWSVPVSFRSLARKKRGGTQVQIVSRIDPPSPARYRSDRRLEWEQACPEESDGGPSVVPISDGREGTAHSLEDRFSPWPDRPLLAHLLLDRYQVRMVLPRYRIRWMGDSDIGVLRSMPCRWTI